jgi:hypothetical protein
MRSETPGLRAVRVADVDLVVPPGRAETGLGDGPVKLLDCRRLGLVRTDVEDLGGRSLGPGVDPELRQCRGRLLDRDVVYGDPDVLFGRLGGDRQPEAPQPRPTVGGGERVGCVHRRRP